MPTLVATFDDESVCDRIAHVARAGGVMYVPVDRAPAARSLHALEVRGPRGRQVLNLVAEVLGPTTPAGAPLRLRFPAPAEQAAGGDKATMGYEEAGVPSSAPAHEVPAPPPPPRDPFIGRALAGGKLVIKSRVGEGGAGTVYRAWHRDLEMSVAVKVMHESFQRDPTYAKRFHAEALAASRLDQANLTRVLDFGQEPDGLLYLAMEFLDGQSLREVLATDGAMTFDRAAQILTQVCSGLTHAHARNVIHRDIKPENIVLVRGLDDDGRETEVAKVCDFGIAHRTTDARAVFAGTPEYMSPEQLRSEDVDVQSDVYACGIVLYELLTGDVPIEGEYPAIVKLVLETNPDPPSRRVKGLDPRVDRLVMKAIAKDRKIRHANIRELRAEIRSLAEDIAVFTSGGYYDVESVTSTRPRMPSVSEATTSGPDWLERGTDYLSSLVPPSSQRMPIVPAHSSSTPPATSRASGVQAAATPSMSPESVETARNVAAFLSKLVDTTDADRFAALVQPLEPKIRALFDQGHIGPAWRLCSTLEMIAREPGPRSAHAANALAVFSDRQLIATLAEKALDFMQDKEGVARKLVVRAGNRGAHALYTARLKHTVFEARERFVAMLTEIGAAGLPTLRVALERLETKLAVPGALGMAEDLLRAVPEAPDEELGQIVSRYVKSNVNGLALLATIALPRSWGMRARPLLVLQVHHRSDDVAIAALKRLRTLGGVDRDLLEQLRPIVMGGPGARPPVRLAAAEALESATPDALPAVRALLVEALNATHGTTPDIEEMIVQLANAIVTTGGDVTLVATRWRQSNAVLRTRLEAVLRRAR